MKQGDKTQWWIHDFEKEGENILRERQGADFLGVTVEGANFDICYARMCILECRIGIVYGDDNVTMVGFVVETSGEAI